MRLGFLKFLCSQIMLQYLELNLCSLEIGFGGIEEGFVLIRCKAES